MLLLARWVMPWVVAATCLAVAGPAAAEPVPEETAGAPAPSAPSAHAPEVYYPQPAPDAPPEAYLVDTPEEGASGSPSRPGRDGGPGAREHEGLFLRFTVGGGVGFTRYREFVDRAVQSVETGGLSGQLEVAIGGRVVGNLMLHASLLVAGVADANKTVAGVKDAASEIDTNLGLLGAGITYYFMPYNVYVSGTFGVGRVSESRDEQLALETGTGVGGALMLGKEWWVGQRAEWGVGAALRGALLSAPVRIAGVGSRLVGSQMTMAFSTTFN